VPTPVGGRTRGSLLISARMVMITINIQERLLVTLPARPLSSGRLIRVADERRASLSPVFVSFARPVALSAALFIGEAAAAGARATRIRDKNKWSWAGPCRRHRRRRRAPPTGTRQTLPPSVVSALRAHSFVPFDRKLSCSDAGGRGPSSRQRAKTSRSPTMTNDGGLAFGRPHSGRRSARLVVARRRSATAPLPSREMRPR
jgi:hypothetical protein